MNKPAVLLAVAILSVLVGAVAWLHAHQIVLASRAQIIAMTLEPVATLLNENQAITNELQAEPFIEKDSGILDSYLIKIRRDGVPRHADMKQRLDQLVENNTAIVTLIEAYSPQAKTAVFTAQARKFRNYAAAWRDRCNALMELFMAGGNYTVSGVPFPDGFRDAVKAEIAAAR